MYKMLRTDDFFLVDIIYSEGRNIEHINIFNHVRIALKVYTASDIVALETGSTILKSIMRGGNYRRSTFGWPKSEPLPTRWMKIWETMLRTYIQPA